MYPERLRPGDIGSMTFAAARLGRRGVDEAQVRAFCEWIERELARLLSEKAALEQEVSRLRAEADRVGTVHQEDGHIQAVGILSRAQQTADQYLANAQEYSREIAEDARRRRDEILAEAKACADLILDEAHTTALRAYLESIARSIDEWEQAG
jgi:cell division septum initiation protein DivIVA